MWSWVPALSWIVDNVCHYPSPLEIYNGSSAIKQHTISMLSNQTFLAPTFRLLYATGLVERGANVTLAADSPSSLQYVKEQMKSIVYTGNKTAL
jgi:hypothetical protein